VAEERERRREPDVRESTTADEHVPIDALERTAEW